MSNADRGLLVRVALWLGMAFGLAEAALVAIAAFGLGRFMHVSPQMVWQAPLAFAIVFLAVAGVALLPWPRLDAHRRLRIVTFVCVAIGATSALMLPAGLGRWAPIVLALGIGVQASYAAVRFATPLRRLVRATLVPAVVLVAALGLSLNVVLWLGGRRATDTPARDGAPNVLLVIWDTVRAANIGLHGYPRATTPHLDSLAERSTVFENAFAPAPWTLPSHAAMFTGLDPDVLSTDWKSPLDDRHPTLAERLRAAGYRTGAFVANSYYAGREAGLARGFEHYEDYRLLSVQQLVRSTALGRRLIRIDRVVRTFDLDPSMELRPAGEITDAALEWIDDAEPGRPFFAFLNYLDAHSPYAPPPPYDTRFGTLERTNKLNFGNGRRLAPQELQAEVDAYDGAIAYLDAELDRLLAALEERGVLDNTIVVLTSDHGEEFGEHEVYLHGSTLFDRSLHVPLVIRAPRQERGVRRGAWVTTRDIPSTILSMAGAGAEPLSGTPLALAASPDAPETAPDTILSSVSRRPGVPERYPAAKGRMVSVMVDPWKYIRAGDGGESLFDLRADRDERHTLIDSAPPALVEPLRARARADARLRDSR